MIEPLMERFNSLTTREKSIFFVTSLVLLWAAWDKFVYQPIASNQKQLSTQLSTIETQLSTLHHVAIQIEAIGKIDPNQENKLKLKQIQAELIKLKQNLDFGDKKFVPAQLMVKVLRDLLSKNRGLNLIALETLPVSTFSESRQKHASIYRHGLSITLSGNYLNTMNYLKSLESLPWRFNWGSIDYQVKDYPIAETTLNLYTLSFEENWLGL